MPYKINGSECTACAACESECPNDAIYEKNGVYAIKTDLCTECVGDHDEAQCASNCPVDCIRIDKSVPRCQAV